MTYDIWPGIGLTTEPVEWNKVLGSAEGKAASTANVERRRKTGDDFSTFRGMSKRADLTSMRGAPKTMRRTLRTGDSRGPARGFGMQEDSWGGKIRAALAAGPMTRAEITAATGIPANRLASYMKNDLRQGRIVRIVREGAFQQLALAEVA
jgi:hypothetical protein